MVRGHLTVVSTKRDENTRPTVYGRFAAKPGARLASALLVVAGILNAIGFAFFFDVVWSYDKLVHAYTSFAVACALAVVLQNAVLVRLQPRYNVIVWTLVAYVLALGLIWELAEWAVDIRGYPTEITGKSDTMIDLIADGVGAWLAAIWVVGRLRAGKRLPG